MTKRAFVTPTWEGFHAQQRQSVSKVPDSETAGQPKRSVQPAGPLAPSTVSALTSRYFTSRPALDFICFDRVGNELEFGRAVACLSRIHQGITDHGTQDLHDQEAPQCCSIV